MGKYDAIRVNPTDPLCAQLPAYELYRVYNNDAKREPPTLVARDEFGQSWLVFVNTDAFGMHVDRLGQRLTEPLLCRAVAIGRHKYLQRREEARKLPDQKAAEPAPAPTGPTPTPSATADSDREFRKGPAPSPRVARDERRPREPEPWKRHGY